MEEFPNDENLYVADLPFYLLVRGLRMDHGRVLGWDQTAEVDGMVPDLGEIPVAAVFSDIDLMRRHAAQHPVKGFRALVADTNGTVISLLNLLKPHFEFIAFDPGRANQKLVAIDARCDNKWATG